MKKVILSSLIAFAFVSGVFAQSTGLSKWSAGVKGGISTIRGIQYSTDWYDRAYNPEFGVFAEKTLNPLTGLGLEVMYVGANNDTYDANLINATVYNSINLTNLLNRFRTSSKFNVYYNTGLGVAFGTVDGGDYEPALAATFGLDFEYNITPFIAVGLEGQYRWNSTSFSALPYSGTKDFYTANLNLRYKFNGVTNNRNMSVVEYERINSQNDATQQAIDKIEYELARQAEEIKKLQEKESSDSIDGVAIKDIIIGQQYQLEQLTKLLTKARKDLYRHLTASGEYYGDNQYDLSSVGFKFGSAKLTKEAYAVLDTLIPSLAQNDKWTIKVLGHTDNVGAEAVNKDLSVRRAKAVKKYLVKKGIVDTRITTEGLAFSKPIACNDTKEGRAKNRRVEVIVNK